MWVFCGRLSDCDSNFFACHTTRNKSKYVHVVSELRLLLSIDFLFSQHNFKRLTEIRKIEHFQRNFCTFPAILAIFFVNFKISDRSVVLRKIRTK